MNIFIGRQGKILTGKICTQSRDMSPIGTATRFWIKYLLNIYLRFFLFMVMYLECFRGYRKECMLNILKRNVFQLRNCFLKKVKFYEWSKFQENLKKKWQESDAKVYNPLFIYKIFYVNWHDWKLYVSRFTKWNASKFDTWAQNDKEKYIS